VSPIIQGLYMTGIGMGLVFIAILALWALMDVLVKVTNERPEKIQSAAVPEAVIDEMLESGADSVAIPSESEMTNAHKAAAAAVAIAISLNQQTGMKTREDKDSISPWLTTRRTNILSQSAALINRKNRGS
jgi:Na+-transporting methylmalonyl-CoA/oxaloacetate decarboxylase gamma subunit